MNRMNEAQQEGMLQALDDVTHERLRQHARFGEQDLPRRTDAVLRAILRGQLETCRKQIAALRPNEPWDLVLLEETCEALLEDDPARLRAELVQVAAVACQWVEAIDRADGGKPAARQPAPVPTGERPTWEIAIEDARRLYLDSPAGPRVIEKFRARDRYGREVYGTRHQASNGRDHHRDLEDEVHDGVCYATAAAQTASDPARRSLYQYVQQMLLHCALLLEAGSVRGGR